MFSNLRLRSKYSAYLRNEDGIKKFAEMIMGQLIRKVTKKSAFYREMSENMLVEKANLRMRQDELYEKAALDAGEFFSTRRQLWGYSFAVALTLLAGIAINLVSAYGFIGEGMEVANVLRWITAIFLALVFTVGGMLIAERLLDTYMRDDEEGTSYLPPALRKHQGALLVLWGVLLAGIELAIIGMAQVEAVQIAGGSGLLFLGIVVAAAIFPLVAGTFRWYKMQYIDRYKTTMALRQIDGRLAQIDSILRQNDETESNNYKLRSIEAWDELNGFKTYKENLNDKFEVEESLAGHFAHAYDLFQAEAHKRYEMDLRDYTTPSMRKLELADKSPVGGKIGQMGEGGARPPMPRSAPKTAPTNNETEDDLLTLRPVR